MTGPDHLLAIDQGTTSTRAMVFDREGRPAGQAQQELLWRKSGRQQSTRLLRRRRTTCLMPALRHLSAGQAIFWSVRERSHRHRTLSQRTSTAHDRLLRVARTIAVLEAAPDVAAHHVGEALQFRR